MHENPLSKVAPQLLVLSIAVVAWQIARRDVDVFSISSAVGAAILFILYRRRSRYAASFLFWTTLPIYPLYFGLVALGVIGEQPRLVVYGIAAAIWIAGALWLLRLRARYIAYVAASVSNDTNSRAALLVRCSDMRIDKTETAIIGSWVISDGGVRADNNVMRIEELRKSHLTEVARSPDGWETLFRDPSDDRLWELTYPTSEMHGGGPPALIVIPAEAAAKKYGLSRI